jgi:hypothetical protein
MTSTHALEHRKAEILRLGQHAVAQRGARRRARRHALLMVALTAGATVLAVTLAPRRIHHEPPIALNESPPTITVARVSTTAGLATTLAATSGTVSIERIEPSTTRVARINSHPPPAERVGDAEALALLREAGRPAGLIKLQGRVTLVYHDQETLDGPSSRAPALDALRTLAALPFPR